MIVNDTASERFWSKVIKDDETGCWNFQGAPVNCRGYRQFRPGGAGTPKVYAYRFSYITMIGPVPDGLQLDHLCRNTQCVNPEHLDPVTPRENNLRRVVHITYCVRGHKFTSDNTYTCSRGWRSCKKCRLEASRRHAAKRAREQNG